MILIRVLCTTQVCKTTVFRVHLLFWSAGGSLQCHNCEYKRTMCLPVQLAMALQRQRVRREKGGEGELYTYHLCSHCNKPLKSSSSNMSRLWFCRQLLVLDSAQSSASPLLAPPSSRAKKGRSQIVLSYRSRPLHGHFCRPSACPTFNT